jgi:KDO2-lipid IV(A) lauroyltransferase
MAALISTKLKNTLLYLFTRTSFSLALLLPRFLGLRLFGTIGRIAFLFPNIEKTRTLEHLRLIYGADWPEERIRKTALSVYESLGKNMFDAIYLTRVNEARFNSLVRHDDLSDFKKAYDRCKGVVAITAHIGCFEMLLHFVARHGFKAFAIGRRMFDSRLEDMVRSIRSGEDIEYMDRHESTLKVVRQLKEGKVFGVLIDQDTRVESVFADFLGRPAQTPSGPVKIAMKFKMPLIVFTTARQSDDTHYVYLSKPVALIDTGDFERDLVTNVQRVNDLISIAIIKNPEQWVWMHRRWKSKPPQPLA